MLTSPECVDVVLVLVVYPYFSYLAVSQREDVHLVGVESPSLVSGAGTAQHDDCVIVGGEHPGWIEAQGAVSEFRHQSQQPKDRLPALILPSQA